MNNHDNVSESEIINRSEFKFFKDYLIKTIQTIMDVEKDDLVLKFNENENESSLAKFLTNEQELFLVIIIKQVQDSPSPEINCLLSISDLYPGCGEALALFKKQDVEIESIKNKKNYLKQVFNVLVIGEIGEDFDVIQLINETLQQGIIPMLQNYKLNSQLGEDNFQPFAKGQNEYYKFNSLFKKFNDLQGSLQQKLNISSVVQLEFEFHPKIKELCIANSNAQISDVPESLLNNQDFIESLCEKRLKWENQTQILMNQGRDNKVGSVMEEVGFWMNLVKTLEDLQKQLVAPPVKLTQEILKYAKKQHEIRNKDAVVKLKKDAEQIERVMSDLNFNQILISLKKDENNKDIKDFFVQIKKLIDDYFYPSQRIKNFVQTINSEYIQMLTNLLRERNMFQMPYPKFVDLKTSVHSFPIKVWEYQIDLFKETLRTNRKIDLIKNTDIQQLNKDLQNRLNLISSIKQEHEDLRQIYTQTFSGENYMKLNLYKYNFPNVKDLEKEFEVFIKLDPMDISVEGQEAIKNAHSQYLKKTNDLDKKIVEKIHQIFEQPLSNNDKFQIFSNFSQLQQRPFIKQELQSYQDNLIDIIKKDVIRIIEKFKKESEKTKNSLMAKRYRISSFMNITFWNEQILNVLNQNIEKLKINLGENWMNAPQGKEIYNICEKFSAEVDKNIKEIAKYCENKYNKKKDENLFSVRNNDGQMQLHVNINQSNKEIIKAISYLCQWSEELSKRYLLKFMFKRVSWPSYIAMYMVENAVNTFNRIINKITPKFQMLLSAQLKTVYIKLEQAQTYTWFLEVEQSEESIIEKFALNFESAVQELSSSTTFLENKVKIIEDSLQRLRQADKKEAHQKSIHDIQEILLEFEEKKFQNQSAYIDDINLEVKEILLEKLNSNILRWSFEFLNLENAGRDKFFDIKDQKIIFQPTIHRLGVQNQQITVDPPLEATKKYWIEHLHSLISQICQLKKIKTKESQMNKVDDLKKDNDFQDLINEVKLEYLEQAYSNINDCIERSEKFIQGWQHYQALWELDVNKVYEFLGENTGYWEDILGEIKAGRTALDETEPSSKFGPIIVQVRLAQRKINNKYEALHNEILGKFGQSLTEEFQDFHVEISKKRYDVENIDFNDSEKIIEGIQELRKCRDSMDLWKNKVDRFRSGEKLLYQQGYQFPATWKQFYVIESEWERFKQVYDLNQEKYKEEYQQLKWKIDKEEATLMKKVKDIEETWQSKKPYSGDLHPNDALAVISHLEKQILDNQKDIKKLNDAKELLELPAIDLTTINSIQEDSKSLKELWTHIQNSWAQIDKIMDTQMKVANPNKFQQTFDNILDEMNGLPNKFRTYEALVSKKNQVQEMKKFNKLLKEIKTDALKESHWNDLCKKIKLPRKYKNLKVGDFYNHNPSKYMKIIDEIIQSAQGELVLENMIKKIRDYWNFVEFDLAKYQEKCMLIKGWDEMMTKIEDDLAVISSMKLSQFYKSFEEEIKGWNDKLVMLQNTLDVWVNVQKKWVYLEGIFLGSSDISQQLPNEYAKFRSIDSDFTSLMKKTAAKKKILDTCSNIPGLEKSLKILYENLEKIQKALSDYLETQRQAFARFYFVGDEDLLEIIGNSKNITNIQKFFGKMFAGINFIENEENGILLKGMRSRENETVQFTTPFKITDYGKINLWLDQLDYQMKNSLATSFERGIDSWTKQKEANITSLVEEYSAQVILISFQTYWTYLIEEGNYVKVIDKLIGILDFMAEAVLTDLPKLTRSKFEQLITEFVHKRDTTRNIQNQGLPPSQSFYWFSQMKYFNYQDESEIINRLKVRLGNSIFQYGYEYLGITEKLVQTPLTDKCYFTLTQALWLRMGGAPFGPAGTGKTESVKMLGSVLGRFVLVFNCDETFNFKAMGRIFIGLCQVGAWGCFDEFNRLEERILSAVSQQILTIQMGLREHLSRIDLMGRDVGLNINMGIFVTMNPGYAGRSNLPENLKQLFRQMAMIKPDRELIAQVMLFSQGFKSAEQLSGKVVSLFELCNDQLSSQPHYDFGLRALKSVLNSAGNLKRKAIKEDASTANLPIEEQKIILRSYCDTVVPKLISDDSPLLESLIKGVFPDADIPTIEDLSLRKALSKECVERNLLESESFIEKILQLNQILKLQHGIMLVGSTGCGKTAAWKSLLSAMSTIDGIKGESYVIDPKAIIKDDLFGKLDDTTLEWTDGIFTYVLRKINENARGESGKRHWIIFDGDVDPEWVENLNSVLDDNKIFTLPNGERIAIPSNVKIIFEVESLKYATLATVSRCGMVWFSDDVLRQQDIFYHYCMRLKMDDYDADLNTQSGNYHKTRELCVNTLEPLIFGKYLEQAVQNHQLKIDENKSLVLQALKLVRHQDHVMEYSDIRILEAFFTLIRKGIERIIEYNEQFSEYPLSQDTQIKFIKKWMLISLIWSFVGDIKLGKRSDFYTLLLQKQRENIEKIDLPKTSDKVTLIDYTVELKTGEWILWIDKVPNLEVDSKDVNNANTIITTVDTLRHQEILCSWLLQKRPFIICGPPGSGKTMTLMSTLRALPDYDMIFVNFSASTTPGLILKQFEHYCEFNKSTKGITLRPKQINKNLVVFCDEINLPDQDNYGTQSVVTFLRQLTEQRGYWQNSNHTWIKLERIQFVGACNPPTDAGRHPLSQRFLRHCPLILVDFPGYISLVQIYGTFNKGMLKPHPEIKHKADELTKAMVECYSQSQVRFTSDQHAHYIYSPRELTRWKYAMFEGLDAVKDVEDLVRLWSHEALRLFEDRLVTDEEKKWTQEAIDRISKECFTGVNFQRALQRPILFSTYLTKSYTSVSIDDLRQYVIQKLKQFNEEEYQIQLVVFDAVLEHIIRIDRVLKQPIGHCLLVGASGVGKTTLSRFVSWMNGLAVYQIKAGRNYGLADFDQNLRDVMKRAGCKQEKITFIFDESNVLGVAFLERMNALLASGEVPGLFEGEEYLALINMYKEYQGNNRKVESDEEIYENFVQNVQRNLHVVFTMNPANPDYSNRSASSPAIFNRCVIDWFGDWSEEALHQVAKELTENMTIPDNSLSDDSVEIQFVLVKLIVRIHNSVRILNEQLQKGAKKFNYMTPRDFLDFINHLIHLHKEKKEILEEQQTHLNKGLTQLKNTEIQVQELDASLKTFKEKLDIAGKEASQKMDMIQVETEKANIKQGELKFLGEELEKKNIEIGKRKALVEEDLSTIKPKLEAAEKAVKNMDEKQLRLLKTMKNPSENVKIPLRAVLLLYKEKDFSDEPGKQDNWKLLLKEMADPNFLKNVLSMNVEEKNKKTIQQLRKKYLNPEIWKMDAFKNAFPPAADLANYIVSQLEKGEILLKIEPLRDEIKELERGQQEAQKQADKNESELKEIQQKLEQFKNEFKILTQQTQKIKQDMEKVNNKVDKSKKLLFNLSSEKNRWTISSEGFSDQLAQMTGDVMISAAFLSYCGFFDQLYRHLLITTWQKYMKEVGLKYKSDISITEFLSTASERVFWQSHKLPDDDICNQNAIILSRFNRYPLIIDPSGQAQDFILSFYNDLKIEKTDFQDNNFLKILEKCLRFGLPVLIQNVEKVDPMMNSVLNKEVTKVSGRILVRIGDQEIDFNRNFKMFMITKNSEAKFTPDLCSRVTFVNFTVTQSSLEKQCINLYLKHERKDIEEKRIKLLKLQGEFLMKLRKLEDDLLNKISEQTGNILENEPLLQLLDTLKVQADEVTKEMEESEKVLQEVDTVTNEYSQISFFSAKIYFTLQKLLDINKLYQYSFQFYMKIIMGLLKNNKKLNEIDKENYQQRIQTIEDEIFISVYHKIENSLMTEDKLLVALKFVQIRLGLKYEEEFKLIMESPTIIESTWGGILDNNLSQRQLIQMESLGKKSKFSKLKNSLSSSEKQWIQFITNRENMNIPLDWLDSSDKISTQLTKVALTNILKPSRSFDVIRELMTETMTNEFLDTDILDAKDLIMNDASSKNPVFFASAAGFDPSGKITEVAKALNKTFTAIALGSQEGFDQADKALDRSIKTGSWVVLKNVHLAISWIKDVEQMLGKSKPHNDFRVFFVSEFNDKISTTLLRQSAKAIFELPEGIKSNVYRNLQGVFTEEKFNKSPKERGQIYFQIIWLHAVIMERLRYTPIGWSKRYEFSEADLKSTIEIIDQFLEKQENTLMKILDPLRNIITNNVYGGKIDNLFDLQILKSLVDEYMDDKFFTNRSGHYFVKDQDNVLVKSCDAQNYQEYINFVKKISDSESPVWAGLPQAAEDVLRQQNLNTLLSKLQTIQDVNDEEILDIKESKKDEQTQLKWLSELKEKCQTFVRLLPEDLPLLERNKTLIENPLFRFLEREVTVCSKLLKTVRQVLHDLISMVEGTLQPLQYLKQLAKQLYQGEVPKEWRKYVFQQNLDVAMWIQDFKKRLDQIKKFCKTNEWQKKGVNVGLMLFPEAFLTASRQFVAQKRSISLDNLQLKMTLTKEEQVDDDSFLALNMAIEGVNWTFKGFQTDIKISFPIDKIRFQWEKCESTDLKTLKPTELFIPIYLNSGRQNLLTPVKFDLKESPYKEQLLYQRGIAFIAWNL